MILYLATAQPGSSVSLLDVCLTAGCLRTAGVPKKADEAYTVIPDLPALRTSYPAEFTDGGEEESWTV